MLDRMSDASRIVEKLVSKDLVERKESPGDRRNVEIVITEKGLSLLGTLDFLDEDYKQIFKNLSMAEIKTLNLLLDKARG
jgi:DNA-binding MarR family transcriptional regulator